MKTWIHRGVALVLAGVMLCSGALAVSVSDFTDVPADAWYYADLERLVQAGSIQGVGDGRFEPESPLTMAQLLKLLGCLLWPGEAKAPAEGETWFDPHVALAEKKGLSDGLTLTEENIEDTVCRYDLAVVAVNAARLQGERIEDTDAVIPYIGDWAQIPEQYREAVAAAYRLGLLQGNDAAGRFQGEDPLTRSQICAVAMRLVEPERRPQREFRSLSDYAGTWTAGDLRLELTAEGAVSLTGFGLTAGPVTGARSADLLRLGEFRDSGGTRYVGVVYLLEGCLYLQLSTTSDAPELRFSSTVLTREGTALESLENQYYTALAGEDAPADTLGLLLLSPTAEQLAALGPYADQRSGTGCEALIVPRYVGSWVRIYDGNTLLRTLLAGDRTTGMLCTMCNGLGRGYSAYLNWTEGGSTQMDSYSFSCDMSGESAGTVVYFR